MISEIETTNGAQEGCNQSFKLSTGSGCQIRDQLMRVFKNQREDLPYTEGQTQPGATPLGVTSGCALAEEEACNHYQGLLQREEKNSEMVSCAKVTHCCPPQPPKAAAPLIPHIPVLDIFPACSLCFIACGSLCLSQHCACCPLSLGMLAVPHPHNARLCFFFSTSQAGGNANVAQSHRAGSVPTAPEPDPTTAHH